MSPVDKLESTLSELFEKKAPKLPAKGKKALVQYAPWASLIIGILSLWAAWTLWQWAHIANSFIDYANAICNTYGAYNCTIPTDRLSLWVWLGLAVLAAEGILYLLAFPGLRAHKKSGWNYLYWGALVNVLYAVVSLFTDYNGTSNFVFALLGSAIGLWLLFQVRSSYTGERTRVHPTR